MNAAEANAYATTPSTTTTTTQFRTIILTLLPSLSVFQSKVKDLPKREAKLKDFEKRVHMAIRMADGRDGDSDDDGAAFGAELMLDENGEIVDGESFLLPVVVHSCWPLTPRAHPLRSGDGDATTGRGGHARGGDHRGAAAAVGHDYTEHSTTGPAG